MLEKLKNKKIIFGITGSIASYKACDIVNILTKNGASVHCIMTESAKEFITKKTLESLSKNAVIDELFPKNISFDIKHISLTSNNDLFIVAPATANIISKFAYGIADDFLSTTFLANKAPVLIAPAMNSKMYTNPIIQDNILRLKNFGVDFISPETGMLACGIEGIGKLASKDTIIKAICEKI